MPELPEVETVARDLSPEISGQIINDVEITWPRTVVGDVSGFRDMLCGARIESVRRLGKFVDICLNDDRHLLVHLKMTGRFILEPWSDPVSWPKYARVALRLSDRSAATDTLYFLDVRKFGRMRALSRPDLDAYTAGINLGPDPFELDAEAFYTRLLARRGRLKSVLLDQRCVSGLGNIYVDESLHIAGLHPLRGANTLSREDSDRLFETVQQILRTAIEERGSTVRTYEALNGAGSFQSRHRVYGRGGQPCLNCGQDLARIIVGGRSTCYCPACQSEDERPEL